jgi:branched-chain amino acid transport system permease protein
MIRDHEIAAQSMGVPVVRYKMFAFALSSAIIGFQGGLLLHFTGSASAESFSFELAVAYVAMVLIGGIDSVAGAVIGAMMITSLPIIVPKVVAQFMSSESAATNGPAIAIMVYGVLVIAFITSSPNGIVGLTRNIWRRLKER